MVAFSDLKKTVRLSMVRDALPGVLAGLDAQPARTLKVAECLALVLGFEREDEKEIANAMTALARDGHVMARQSVETFQAMGRTFHRWEWRVVEEV